MRKQRKNLTPHIIRRVLQDYAGGAPIALIGRQFGIHETTVCLIAKRGGVPRRGRDWRSSSKQFGAATPNNLSL